MALLRSRFRRTSGPKIDEKSARDRVEPAGQRGHDHRWSQNRLRCSPMVMESVWMITSGHGIRLDDHQWSWNSFGRPPAIMDPSAPWTAPEPEAGIGAGIQARNNN